MAATIVKSGRDGVNRSRPGPADPTRGLETVMNARPILPSSICPKALRHNELRPITDGYSRGIDPDRAGDRPEPLEPGPLVLGEAAGFDLDLLDCLL